ncbi:MAG: DUF2461 domain-containing protein [Paludibacteraceae bacterium]|nr:DUF2461 domain-containing protein [Paludibacteraceae bacterium]
MYDSDNILRFLTAIDQNNNREWFAEHRDWYEQTINDHQNLVSQMIAQIGSWDSEIAHLQPKDCIYRIYRDTRFSPDKSPYKRYLGAYVAAPNGKRSIRAGYYLHLQPGSSFFAAGYWYPDKDRIRAVRQSIVDNYDELEEIMYAPEFVRAFGDMDSDDMLKTVPRGFDRDFVHADWLRRRSFTISHRLSDLEVRSNRLMPTINRLARLAAPYNRFFNFTVDELAG